MSTLSFRTELHKLPPDFWSKVSQRGQSSRNDGMIPQGVDNSKMILEAILGKIKLYEKGQDKKWAELIQVRVVFKVLSGTQNTFWPVPEYWQPVLRCWWRWIWFQLVEYWRSNNWIHYFTSQKPKFLFFEFTNTTPEKNWKSFRIDQHNVYHSFFFSWFSFDLKNKHLSHVSRRSLVGRQKFSDCSCGDNSGGTKIKN